jgi:hypothetical protein
LGAIAVVRLLRFEKPQERAKILDHGFRTIQRTKGGAMAVSLKVVVRDREAVQKFSGDCLGADEDPFAEDCIGIKA